MFIRTADAHIFATAHGPVGAPAIIGLGGWIGSSELWAEPFAQLSARWRAIAYDHRGSGVTVAPVATITYDRMVEDVILVMDAFAVERGVLAAESAGAAIAVGAALRYPGRITGLVLVDGAIAQDSLDPADPFVAGLRGAFHQTLHRFVEACVPEPDSDHFKRWGRQIVQRASQEAAIALYGIRAPGDVLARLGAITQPTLLVHGDADGLVPVASSRRLAATLPNSRLVVIAGCGHVPTVTRPDAVATEIEAYFRGEH